MLSAMDKKTVSTSVTDSDEYPRTYLFVYLINLNPAGQCNWAYTVQLLLLGNSNRRRDSGRQRKGGQLRGGQWCAKLQARMSCDLRGRLMASGEASWATRDGVRLAAWPARCTYELGCDFFPKPRNPHVMLTSNRIFGYGYHFSYPFYKYRWILNDTVSRGINLYPNPYTASFFYLWARE